MTKDYVLSTAQTDVGSTDTQELTSVSVGGERAYGGWGKGNG